MIERAPLKIVLDTQIFLRAAINPNSACGRIVFNELSDYQLYSADQIDAEIKRVLKRPAIRLKFPQINDKRAAQVMLVAEQAEHVQITTIEPVCRDPKDDIFLACAKAASADYLVSEDKDLLDLKQHHTTRIINVATFLTALDQKRPSSTPENE